MSKIVTIPTYEDIRGSIGVLEKCIPFDIKRVYYIYNIPASKERGGHAHKKTTQAFVCLNGTCSVNITNLSTKKEESFQLTTPQECLIVNPEDWHTLSHFSQNTVLLVLASEYYDASDYIYEKS